MIWLLIILFSLTAALILLLTPRLFLKGEYKTGTAQFKIRWLWLSLVYNSATGQTQGRILIFRFSSPKTHPPAAPKDISYSEKEMTLPAESKTQSAVPPPPPPLESPPREAAPEKKRKKIKADKTKPLKGDVRFWWNRRALLKDLIRRLGSWLRGAWRAFRIDYLRSRVVCASSDAALTGMMFGLLQPLAYNLPRRVNLLVEADFERDRPEWEGEGSLSFRPLVLLAVTLGFILRLPWLRLYRLKKEMAGKD